MSRIEYLEEHITSIDQNRGGRAGELTTTVDFLRETLTQVDFE